MSKFISSQDGEERQYFDAAPFSKSMEIIQSNN